MTCYARHKSTAFEANFVEGALSAGVRPVALIEGASISQQAVSRLGAIPDVATLSKVEERVAEYCCFETQARKLAPMKYTQVQKYDLGFDDIPLDATLGTIAGHIPKDLLHEINGCVDCLSPTPQKQAVKADFPVRIPPRSILRTGVQRAGLEGADTSEQNILAVHISSDNCIIITATLLVSGFIIGAKGASIREIQGRSGVQIRSWNQVISNTTVRMFSVQGPKYGQCMALEYMMAAVERYKHLAEGPCCKMKVSQLQTVRGIAFWYKPPPKKAVPFAASLRHNEVVNY